MKIKADTLVSDAIKMSKEVAKVLNKYKLDCAGCRGAVEDTIDKVAVNNGLDVKQFLDDLNEAVKPKA